MTLLEKLDALQKRVPDEKTAPARFVRHFEDAAHIIDAAEKQTLPPLPEYPSVRELAAAMLADKSLVRISSAADAAFVASASARWENVRTAHRAIDPMFWGPRLSIDDCCARIQSWIRTELAA